MSFTFSNNQEVDYPALGMCDTCGKRFTQGCEHSNTLEAQKWLAAHLAAEQGSGISVTEEQADSVHNMIVTAESTEEKFTDGFSDPALDEAFKAEQLTGYFGKVKVTTSKEWDKRHLYATRKEQAGAAERRKAAGFKGE